ncbi:MAG: hypothetical protein M1368_01880, partial [Thaumarchaeota archaeon]|nr:hypothetical protein [Nitrososphaerota archaeon]
MRIEQAPRNDESVISYFEKDGIRNVLNIWNLEREENGFELHVCRIGDEAKGHISMYTTPRGGIW